MADSVFLKEPPIHWVADLAASTASTVIPTSATAGKSIADLPTAQALNWHNGGNRLAVMVDAQGSAPVSTDIHVYGYDAGLGLWSWVASMNGGASIASNVKWNISTTHFRLAEFISVSTRSYDRYATRAVNSGAGAMSVSTWIGFPVG